VELLVLYGSHHIIVMRLGQPDLRVELVVIRSQSVVEILCPSPQLGLKPAPHTSEALAERNLSGSQHILGN
jgi:hypothetical protein